jgi:hypothetical protein
MSSSGTESSFTRTSGDRRRWARERVIPTKNRRALRRRRSGWQVRKRTEAFVQVNRSQRFAR